MDLICPNCRKEITLTKFVRTWCDCEKIQFEMVIKNNNKNLIRSMLKSFAKNGGRKKCSDS